MLRILWVHCQQKKLLRQRKTRYTNHVMRGNKWILDINNRGQNAEKKINRSTSEFIVKIKYFNYILAMTININKAFFELHFANLRWGDCNYAHTHCSSFRKELNWWVHFYKSSLSRAGIKKILYYFAYLCLKVAFCKKQFWYQHIIMLIVKSLWFNL